MACPRCTLTSLKKRLGPSSLLSAAFLASSHANHPLHTIIFPAYAPFYPSCTARLRGDLSEEDVIQLHVYGAGSDIACSVSLKRTLQLQMRAKLSCFRANLDHRFARRYDIGADAV